MKSMSAFLRLYRKRLWLATGFSMIVVLADFYLFGVHFGGWNVFWHGVCNCRMSATDTRALLTACLFICFYVGAGLGFPTGRGAFALNPESGSAPHGDTRFLLTRPVSRACLLVQPLAIVSCALALVTILPILLLTGWLWMVKAPALVHIKALLQLVPAASMLGPDASLWSVATAAHFWRYDAAAWSLGLCSYALMSSQRWLVLCQNVRLKVAGGLIMPLLLYAPINGSGAAASERSRCSCRHEEAAWNPNRRSWGLVCMSRLPGWCCSAAGGCRRSWRLRRGTR